MAGHASHTGRGEGQRADNVDERVDHHEFRDFLDAVGFGGAVVAGAEALEEDY
jgi:hypothetical protein